MDPAFQSETGKNDEDEPTERAVQGSPGERSEDRIGYEGLIKARAGSGIGRWHLIEW